MMTEDRDLRIKQIEQELQAFSTLDDATKSWLYALHRIWNLCKSISKYKCFLW